MSSQNSVIPERILIIITIAEKKKMEYRLAMQQIASLKENIKEMYEGTTEELTNKIASYDEKLSGKNDEIAVVSNRRDSLTCFPKAYCNCATFSTESLF